MESWNQGDVIANGIRIHYTRTGRGDKPPVILCHGFSDSGLCWTPVARELEADYDVIMPDARGHGLSEAPATAYSSPKMAADLADFIQVLGLDRPVVMGHSMGGFSTTLLAADYGDCLRAAILEDPGWRPKTAPPTESVVQARLAEGMANLQSMKEMSREALIARCHQESPKWSEDELGPWADAKLQLSPQIAYNYTHVREPYDEVMARVRCPVLLITANVALGSNVTAEMAAEAQRIWPQTEVVNVPESGHNIRREGFDKLITAVKEFLARQYPAD